MKKIIIIVAVLAILIAGFIIATGDNDQQVSGTTSFVNLLEAEEETMITRVSADGTVLAETEMDLKARLNGRVEEVFLERGSLVEESDPIYCLEDKRLINSLQTTKLNLKESQANYQNLLDKYSNQGILNNLRLEESSRSLEIALLSYQNEESSLNDQKIKLENQVVESREAMEKSLESLEVNKFLYEKDAIPQNTLKQHEDNYRQAQRNYQRAESDLNLFVNKTMPNSLELSQLQIDNARNQLNFLKASIEADRITEKDLELAKDGISRVENQIIEIEEDLKNIVSYAPMSGTIISMGVKKGDTIVEGASVAKIADLNSFIVEAMVDEIHINQVKKGQDVIINSDSFSEELEGHVQFIAPAGSQQGNINKYQTEILIAENKGLLRPGMFVNIEIITEEKEKVIAVPSLAILGDEERFVFVVNDGKAEKRMVETGLRNISSVEIIGLEAGEKIIIGPYTVLRNMEEGRSVTDLDN